MKNNKYSTRFNYFLFLSLSLLAGSFFSIQALIWIRSSRACSLQTVFCRILSKAISVSARAIKSTELRWHNYRTKRVSTGNFPKRLSWPAMDSRSIPELVFDQSIADIFTLRVAGNVVNDDMVASIEYATKFVGAKLIVIMGHTKCGAIKAACAGGAPGHIKALVPISSLPWLRSKSRTQTSH